MKQESVLQILTYLFENYLRNDFRLMAEPETLFIHLEEMGFEPAVINHAFEWLEGLVETNRHSFAPSSQSFRIFSPLEQLKLDRECQGFIHLLEKKGLLSPTHRERVIDRAIELVKDKVSLHQIKWITLLVLFNQTGVEAALACMEQFVLNEDFGIGH